MMIRLIIDNKEADLLNDEFTWNMQCADFFSFDTRQFSCSDVMYLPMSSTNNEIFELAGMVGSVSRRPQRAFDVELLIDGIPIVRNAKGYLMGVQNDTYKFAFHESTKDIYHWLNLCKLSDVIGDKLNHNKTKEVIEKTFRNYERYILASNEPFDDGFLYPVAEYGGDTLHRGFTDVLGLKSYNFYYAPPAIHVPWIFKEVQRMSGHTFEGSFFNTGTFKTLFITTSQVINENAPAGALVSLTQAGKTNETTLVKEISDRQGELYLTMNSYNSPTYFRKKQDKDYIYQIPADKLGTWDLVLSGRTQGTADRSIMSYVEIYKNDDTTPICTTRAGVGGYVTQHNHSGGWNFAIRIPDYFAPNDKIYIRLLVEADSIQGKELATWDLSFKIEQNSRQFVNHLVSELYMLDLFKELLIMFGLTPMKLSIDDEVQHFYTIDERLNDAPILDWSEKFVRVTNLEFHAPTSSYARCNHFKYKKYDEQDGNQLKADGVLVVDDDLLTFKKEREGKFFAGVDNDKTLNTVLKSTLNTGRINIPLNDFYFWEKELKEKEEGGQKKIEISHKAKDNRFHIFNVENYDNSIDWEFPSAKGVIKGGNINSEAFTFLVSRADFWDLRWNNLLQNYYSGFNDILNHMRVYTCEMNLNALDIYEFNFFKRIYIAQLGGLFLPNKITFKTNTLAVVELIKIEPIK